jgi:SAM-dependent methyltransferase
MEESSWVKRFAPLVRAGGTVLDVAAGRGRHARFFLNRGHRVTAVDRDAALLAGFPAGIETIAADLEGGSPWEDGSPWPLAGRRFDAVTVVNYLHRPLFPALLAALAPAGVLIYETFGRGNERFGRPANPDFLLEPAELLAAFGRDLQVVAYECGRVEAEAHRPRPAVVQRLCAVAPSGDDPLPPRLL